MSEPTLDNAGGSIGTPTGSKVPPAPTTPKSTGGLSTTSTPTADVPTTVEPTPEVLPVADTPPVASDDVIAVSSVSAIELGTTLLANDSDSNLEQTVSLLSVNSSASQGTVVFNATTQSILYTPSATQLTALGAGATGTDQFTYQIESGALVDTGVVTINLTGVNDAPVATNDSFTITADQNLNVPTATGLLANDTDPDTGDTLSLTGATVLTSDQTPIAIQADGSFDFLITSSPGIAALNTGETLTSQFSYIVSDAAGSTSTAIATIVVTGVNDAPVTVADSLAVAEASATTIAPLGNDSDPEGDSFSIIGATASTGNVTVSADGTTVDYTARDDLAEGIVSSETITYTVSDGNGSSTGTINVAVTGVNDPPIITPLVTPLEVVIGSGVVDLTDAILATISDDGGEPVTLTGVDNTGTLGTVIFGSVTYDAGTAFDFLNLGETAVDTFGVGVVDSTGLNSNLTFPVKINGLADAPVVSGPLTLTALDNAGVQSLNLLNLATDIDTTDVLSVTNLVITGDQTGVTVTNNIATITPSAYTFGAGVTSTTITLTYNVTDTTNLSVAQTAMITITNSNSAPVVTAPVTATLSEDAVATSLDLLSGATDVDGDTLTVTALTVTGNVAGITQTGTTLSINPAAYNTLAASGSEAITYSYTIDDGRGGTVAQTASITITGANDAPVTVADTNVAFEDVPLLVTTATGVLLNDTDVDAGSTFTVTAVQGSPSGVGLATTLTSGATIILNADGSYDFTPGETLAAGQTGQDVISYTITDDQGATSQSSITITVTGNNDAPVTVADTNTIDEDGTLLVLTANGVLINDTDVDIGATRTVTAVLGLTANVGVPVTLASGSLLILNADGSYDFTPGQELSLGQTSQDVINFTVTDDQGATAADTLTITVTGNNDLPTVSPSFFSTLESQFLISGSSLLLGSFDPDPLDILAFTDATIDGVDVFANTSTLLNSGATVTIDSAGIVNFDGTNSRFIRGLDAGEFTTESFLFTIDDGQGGTAITNFSIDISGESSPELLIFSHDDALFIEPGLDIVGDTALDLRGARITVGPDEYQDLFLLTVADTGANVVNAVTNFAALTANALQIDRDFFAFTENRFAVDDRIATVTIEGLINEVNDNADAFVVNANFGETLIIDIDGASEQGLAGSPVEVTIFDSAGNLLVTQTNGNQFDIGSLDTFDPIFTFTATASDSYFIIVSSQDTLLGPTMFDPGLASTSDYTLQLSLDTLQPGEFFGNDVTIIDETEIEATEVIGDILPGFDFAFELTRDSFKTAPNQLVENSTSVSTVTILGELRESDASDMVKVFLNGGETLSLDFDLTNLVGSGFEDRLPIQATFFDATGTSIVVNPTFTNDAGSPTSEEFYTFTAPTTGEYYISLDPSGGFDSTGDYIAHFSIDVIDLGGMGATVLNERELGSPEFRPEIEDVNFSIDANFGVNAFISDIGDVLLFGETTPANYELILQSFAFEGLLSDPNDRSRVNFSAIDNNGEEFNITSRDVTSVSTEVQIADIINGNGADGALLPGVFNTESIQGNLIRSGDFNGDGFDDLLVSDNSFGYTSTLVYGASSLPSDLSFASQAAINVATMGPMGSRSDTYVHSIGFAGDFNGDGFDDFVVNFSFTENYGSMLPRVVDAIVFGAAGPSGGINLAPATTVLTDMIVFETNYGVIPLGDMDGDGFDDIAVLAYGGPYHEIIFGQDPTNFTPDVNAYGRVDPFTLGAAVDKIAVNRTGNSPVSTSIGQTYDGPYNIENVVPVGDTNGDGFDDLVLDFGINSGVTYLVFGDTRADIELLANQDSNETLDSQEFFSDNGIFLLANQNNPYSNDKIVLLNGNPHNLSPIQPLGDINGDGFTDLLFNLVPSDTQNGKYLANVGSVVVFGGPGLDDFAGDIGQAGLTLADVIDDGGAHGFRITSSELQDSVLPKNLILSKVENVGDINGDGFDDLLIAAKVTRGYGYDQVTNTAIVADPVILYGGPSLNNTGGTVDVSQLGSDEGFSLRDGFQAYSSAKDSLDSIGDINGDGFNDFSLRGSDLAGGISGYADIDSQLTQGTLVVFGGGGIGTPDNAFTGSSSDDQFSAFPGSQIVRMGAGDDTIIYDPADTLVDGGSGSDAIIADGSIPQIDITGTTNLSRIEAVDLAGFGNTLVLDASSIIELSDSNSLTISGSGTDSVVTADTGWISLGSSGGFDIYANGAASLIIDQNITSINQTVNLTLGGFDQSLTSPVSMNTSISISLADAASALTEINGGGFTLNDPITLDSGATLTVKALSLGNATIVYAPDSAFDFLESGEVALDQFTFTSDNGSGFEVNTFRLNVEDPTPDPIEIVFGTPQAYTGGLFVPLFDPAISVTDVDSPFATILSVSLDNTSTMTTTAFGYLSVDPDLDPNFNFVIVANFTSQDLVQLIDYNGQSATTSQIEEFLQAIRYIPSDQDPAVATFFVSISQADTTLSLLAKRIQQRLLPRQ